MSEAKVNKKITIEVPRRLLSRAMKATGRGITPTVRQALRLLAAKNAYAELQKLKGKVSFSIDLKKLREDRQ